MPSSPNSILARWCGLAASSTCSWSRPNASATSRSSSRVGSNRPDPHEAAAGSPRTARAARRGATGRRSIIAGVAAASCVDGAVRVVPAHALDHVHIVLDSTGTIYADAHDHSAPHPARPHQGQRRRRPRRLDSRRHARRAGGASRPPRSASGWRCCRSTARRHLAPGAHAADGRPIMLEAAAPAPRPCMRTREWGSAATATGRASRSRTLAKDPMWKVVQAHPSAAVFPGAGRRVDGADAGAGPWPPSGRGTPASGATRCTPS